MNCPHCLVIEIDATGSCPRCGHRIAVEAPESGRADPGTPPTEGADAVREEQEDVPATGDADGPEVSAAEEIPGWRKELSERLRAIKEKKGAAASAPPVRTPLDAAGAPGPPAPAPDAAAAALRAEIMERMKARKPAPRPPAPVPLQKKLEPLKAVPPAPADPRKIRSLIDTAVSRRPAAAAAPGPLPVPPAPPPAVYEPAASGRESADSEGKLILLSRTLSGLVDLICIVTCVGIMVFAADGLTGTIMMDAVSVVHFSALFLLAYFVYSIFFLFASSQTIGMMITDLRVVGRDGERPSKGQFFGRCGGYLLSLFGIGLGLLWALASRDNLCLHDRISGTRVVRT
jgi:uncharacterized RDD family membrane protein YckC